MTGTTLKSSTSQFKIRVAGKCAFRSLKVEEQRHVKYLEARVNVRKVR